jgi:hypothetical protein
MKWCLVGAGLKDLARPPEKLSVSQNVGACTLVHWRVSFKSSFSTHRNGYYLGTILFCHHPSQLQSRGGMYSFDWPADKSLIHRKVNFFVGLSGLTQLGRIAK